MFDTRNTKIASNRTTFQKTKIDDIESKDKKIKLTLDLITKKHPEIKTEIESLKKQYIEIIEQIKKQIEELDLLNSTNKNLEIQIKSLIKTKEILCTKIEIWRAYYYRLWDTLQVYIEDPKIVAEIIEDNIDKNLMMISLVLTTITLVAKQFVSLNKYFIGSIVGATALSVIKWSMKKAYEQFHNRED